MKLPTEQTSPASMLKLRIYYIHSPLLAGTRQWEEAFSHARDLGFDTVLISPPFMRLPGASIFVSSDFSRLSPELGLGENAEEGLGKLVSMARAAGLQLMLDLAIDAEAEPEGSRADVVDPRIKPQSFRSRPVNFHEPEVRRSVVQATVARLRRLVGLGITGFRCLNLSQVPVDIWRELIGAVRSEAKEARFLAWTSGVAAEDRASLAGIGFDAAFSSLGWWNGTERWIEQEHDLHRSVGEDIAFPEAPFARRIAHGVDGAAVRERRALRALRLAAALGDGLLIPIGFEYGASSALDALHTAPIGLRGFRDKAAVDLSDEIRQCNRTVAERPQTFNRGPWHVVDSTKAVSAIVQFDAADRRWASRSQLVLVNRDLKRSAVVPLDSIGLAAGAFLPLREGKRLISPNDIFRLAPGEVRIVEGEVSQPILAAGASYTAAEAGTAPRIAIETIEPTVDGGRFPIKRILGEKLTVEADIFADGHDPLAAALRWRAVDEDDWNESRMVLLGNDRWRAEFSISRLGRHEFVIEAWRDRFGIFRYELVKKNDARLDLKLEVQEGLILVKGAQARAEGEVAAGLASIVSRLTGASDAEAVQVLLDPETARLMSAADDRSFKVTSAPMPVDGERQGAAFASWYQIFPRSQSGDAHRHGTFDDVIKRLPAIKAMGFDVLYFPPIHPIGKTNRKGRNNSLTAGPDDPGSPYAIGSEDGGHDAIHPQLGTFEDFRRLVAEAQKHDLEIALDLAIQASPDHPWLKQHPGWFDWRPDGSVKYAENPPKKYEDIVNVDFYAKDAVPSLWEALRDVVEMWVDQGVKLFRVDNPHTKPFPFWEWMIADIRARHPDVVFLSEAFTRPRVMYRLAKIGFSQSYTYFTWRDAKWELEAYMRELTTEAPKEFFRPHFFVNTHDINPDFLQNAPRPAFVIRAALAATLSGLWGVYNGFELCEGRPDVKRKEYADSEKYEIRAWDYDRPGNIIPEITLLNQVRRTNLALQSHLGLTLLPAFNDNIMFFEKASPGRDNVVLVAISLDPHHAQEADVEIPLWKWGLPDSGALAVEDLVAGGNFVWTGKYQRLRLNPASPFAIWRVRPREE